jgi:hypothetical protein
VMGRGEVGTGEGDARRNGGGKKGP